MTRLITALSSRAQARRVALVQGASRGIGLEYVKQLLARPDYTVFPTCRAPPETIGALRELKTRFPGRCLPVQLDCTSEVSIAAASAAVRRHTDYLNLLINVSGVLHTPEGMKPEKTYRDLKVENVLHSLRVNAVGPALVMKHFVELLVQAEHHGATQPAVLANMSARVSSIGDNAFGGWMSYRASKCALNQLTKCFAIELANKKKSVVCFLLHPGTVDTDMSRPFQRNVPSGKLFSRERAVEQLLRIIDGADLSQSGKFFAWDGTEIKW